MVRKWVSDEKLSGGVVEIDPRNLKMQSAQAIRSVTDALEELITNSDDAYHKIGDKKGKIIIEITRERTEKSGVIVVKDRAGGMSRDEMQEKILKYGGFQAAKESRGFMGRGAKDIVALGKARFESIKNGTISCVELDSEFRKDVKKSAKAVKADYDNLGIRPNKGGMKVTLEVSKQHKVPHNETLVRDLQRHYALRDIIQNREVRIIDTRGNYNKILRYSPPDGELFYEDSLKFKSPYEGASADIKLYKAPKELPSELQEGIIVCDGHAIHQVTRFDSHFDTDPIARRFFGRLECKYIRKLQLDFEDHRNKGLEHPEHNPVDIIDPNRRRGLDRTSHPFVMKLFDWASEVLKVVVEEVREEEGQKEVRVANRETKKRLKKLSAAIAKHLKYRIEEETLAPKTQEQEANLQNEGVLLNPQFTKIEVGEIRRLGYTVISFGKNEDPDFVNVKIGSPAIKVNNTKPKLKPQRRNQERLSAYFEIRGIEPAESVELLVSHANELIKPVSRQIEVIEKEDPYSDLPYGLFFEKQNYTVHNNGTRTLSFIAKGRRFRKTAWEAPNLVKSSRPEAITILRGCSLCVESVIKDIWKGTILVRGNGIGKSSIVTLSVPSKSGTEVANARVKVVEKDEPAGVSIEIEIVPDQGGQWRASWDRDNPNLLKVYAEHPTLKRYLGTYEQGYPGQNQPHFRILLAEIIADKVVQRIFEAKAEINPRLFNEPQRFFYLYSEEMSEFLPVAHQIMISDKKVFDLKKEWSNLDIS